MSRRNPRRQASEGPKVHDDNAGEDDDGSRSESASIDEDDASSSEEEEEEERPTKRRGGGGAQQPSQSRTSSRSTRFRKSMKEPKDGISDLLARLDEVPTTPRAKQGNSASPRHSKSPAVRHSSRRRRMHIEMPVEESEYSSEEGGEEESHESEEEGEEEEEESLKIQRIVASRSETRRKWQEECKKINTSEIDYGSRWFQKEENVTEEDLDAFEERFLVKWADLSYMHCSWETQDDLIDQVEGAKTYLTTFFRKNVNGLLFDADERNDGDYFDPGFVQIERILEVASPDDLPQVESDDPIISQYGIVMDKAHEDFERGTGRQFLIKWVNTPYAEATFEFERDLIINDVDYVEHLAAFEKRSQKPSSKEMRRLLTAGDLELRRMFKMFGDESNVSEEKMDEEVKAYQAELEKHMFKNGGQLRDYQAEGVSWLMSNYVNERSSILADEMGLGKTIQTAAFVNLIATRVNLRGPFLIVAPLSTIPHWYREFTGWTDLNTIVYHGSALDREIIREMEFPFECDRPRNGVGFNASYLKKCIAKGRPKDHTWMAQVVITTPEMLVTDDFTELTSVQWEVIVVDEAHRLKNHNSKLAVNLRHKNFSFGHSVLLTGTPIQNDMKELWTLLNFIDAETFTDLEDFLEQYGDIKSKEGIDELHETIRPYILRRLKEDVEKSVPPKEETLIEVELTLLQKQYYRALYEKNLTFLHKNKKKALDGPSLNNLAMQLRKCCNHPFLLNGIEEEVRKQEDPELSEGDFLAKASGKLVLLDKLLPRLKEQGHKVLLFSQFKIMLDILEDYLAARELKTERIDGSITGHKRQMAIDRFQSPSNEAEAPFVMLLSTRAGGVGINLTAADTCIIFDSDWNPQNDLQAQARCHRIGQTKSVKVYRLLTRKTYEMQMFHLASMKMGLDQAVLQGFEGGSSSREATMTKEEVERLLRHGAYDIFNEEKAGTAESESNDFVQQDIDSILARRSKTVVHENTGTGSSAAGGTFSKASFRAPKTPNGAETKGTTDDIDIDDPDFWKKMVGEEHLNAGFGDDLAGKKRKRNKTNYSERDFDQKIEGAIVMSDDGGSSSSAEFDSDSDDESLQDGSPHSIKDLADSDAGKAAAPPVPGATKPRGKKIKKRKKEKARWGGSGMDEWSKSDVNVLLKALHSYGYGNHSWEDFRDKAGLSKTKYSVDAVKRMSWSMVLFIMHEAAQEDAQSNKKKAERAAEKRRETEVSDQDPLGGGVLGKSPTPTAELVASKEDIEASFSKLLSGHSAWLGHPLSDATSYAQSNSPRPKEKLDRTLQECAGKEPALRSKHGMLRLFSESLWPSLKSRGWTTEQVTQGAYSGATHYRHGGEEYRSPEAVLKAVPSIHSELTGVVESINRVMASESDNLAESAKAAGALDVTSLTAESLNKFLNMFAPLQLLVDRAQQRSLSLPRKTLSTCGFMKNAHDVVRHSTQGESDPAAINRIAMVLSPDKRMALPHPAWTPLHDAVLVQAIAKHGWIDQDRACRAITNDSSIKWGVPFDEALPASEPTALNMQALRETAERVAEFLNVESELLEELKSFNQNLLVNGYGLTKVSEDAEWSVSDALLQNVAGAKLKASNGESSDVSDDQQGSAGGMAELPTKKDLLKRAKSLLSRSHASSQSGAVAEGTAPTADHGFIVLDQSDPCNTFLSEMIRVLARSSFTKNSKARSLGQKLCADAIREATFRKEASGISATTSDMGKIVDQLKLVARTMKSMAKAAKNLLKVMVGITPLPAKAGERLFPPTGVSELELVRTTQAASRKQSQKSKKPKESAAQTHGDRAIARSVSRVLLQRKTDRDFSREVLVDLELDSTEVLLLCVICCRGIPVWSEHWDDPVARAENADLDQQEPGSEDHALTWIGLATIFSSASKQWHKASLKKLEDKRAEYNEKFGHSTPAEITDSQSKLWEELQQAEIEERFKCHTIALAEECKANPVAFAKKAVMLMETVRRSMGSVETKKSTLKKIHSMAKTEHGLGPLVLNWFGKELTRWAKAFDIKDHTGRPHPFTTSTFVHDSVQYANDNRIGVHALFDKKACRSVFGQAAQQTRLRAIFLKRNEQDATAAVKKAAKHCRSIGEMWTRQPQWWEAGGAHDCQLLLSLLEGGYTGLEVAFVNMQPPGGDAEENAEANAPHPSVQMTKGGAQERANQLTRELHSIDDTADAIQHLREKIPTSVLAAVEATEEVTTETVTDGAAASLETAKPAHVPVQKGIDSFFKPAAAKKPAASEVIVLDDGNESEGNSADESQALSPAKRTASDEVADDEEASQAKKHKASP